MKQMRFAACAVLVLLVTLPATAQESDSESPDYSREALRSIFLQAAREAEEAQQDPFKSGVELFSFTLGGTKTTVRFALPSGRIPGNVGTDFSIVIDPFLATGTAVPSLSPRGRNRYSEWWVNRKLGFPISPPKESD